MFGYVLPDKPELKIKEYETYRAFYCGVCKTIKRNFGNLPRLTLSYDAAFLALFLSSVSGDTAGINRERCMLHPAKKRFVIAKDKYLEYAADMNILLSYLSFLDKWVDDRSITALTARIIYKPYFKKLSKKYPEKTEVFITGLKELADFEMHNMKYHDIWSNKKNSAASNEESTPHSHSLDEAAEPFAKLTEELVLFEPVLKTSREEPILRWVGYNLGKWVYTIDAYDDTENDIRKKLYNPLLFGFGYKPGQETAEEFKLRIKSQVEYNLMQTLNELSKGLELLDIKVNKSIIENIIYLGMHKKTKAVLGLNN